MNTKVVIIHNLLWTHYKAVVHSELHKQSKDNKLDIHVIQVCTTRNNRKNMGSVNEKLHNYPYTLLFNKPLESTSVKQRAVAIFKEVKKLKPDILIVSYADKAYLPTIFLSKFLGIKLIMNFNSNEVDHKRNFFIESFKSLMLKIPVKVFCYGSMQAKYVNSLGVENSKIWIRFQTTDVNGFKEKLDALKDSIRENCLVYVGRITEIKNLKFLISGFQSIASKGWELKLVGDGKQLESLQSWYKANNFKSVKFLGGKTQAEVIEYYRTSKIFVLPSLVEPWGLVVNEAMMCGLPILVSSHCGASEDLVHEGINGFTFDPKNIDSLISVLQKLTHNSIELEKFGQESLRIISDYTPETTASQMIKGIQSIL